MPKPSPDKIEHANGIPWRKIPPEVKDEADELADYTHETGREGSITFCKKRDKSRIFVGNNFQGNQESTLALSCDARFGKSEQIGSMHSHPSNIDIIGVVPSESDLTSNVEEAADQKRKQIDCITSPDTPLINCYSYRGVPDRKTVAKYQNALNNSWRKTDPYFIDHVDKDFAISLFDKESGDREDNPPAKKVIKAAFGKSNKELRKSMQVFEKGQFCEYVADLMGQGHRDDVIAECKSELKRRKFLGIIDY